MAARKNPANKKPKTEKRIVTQDDLDMNPDLIEQGVQVGDEIEVPVEDSEPVKGKAAPHYERWAVQIHKTDKGPKAEKLKIRQACVKITEDEAATLNHGVLHGGNSYAEMYFLPE